MQLCNMKHHRNFSWWGCRGVPVELWYFRTSFSSFLPEKKHVKLLLELFGNMDVISEDSLEWGWGRSGGSFCSFYSSIFAV